MSHEENYFKEVRDCLNSLDFEKCEGVLVGDALYYNAGSAIELDEHISKLSNVLLSAKYILFIFIRLLISRYKYKHQDGNRTLFLFSSSYGFRSDMRKNFMDVYNIAPDSGYAIFRSKGFSVSMFKLKYIPMFVRWYNKIMKMQCLRSCSSRVYLVWSLVNVYCDFADAENFFGAGFKNTDCLVSWCDIHAVDSFFTQKFNHWGKKTICLMHGAIGIYPNPWSIYGIKSKFFIADSIHTKKLLEECHYDGEVYVCGFPADIEQKKKGILSSNNSGNKRIGVVLGSSELHDCNLNLCETLQKLKSSVLKGYEIFVKLHPSESIDDYRDEILSGFNKIYSTDITSGDFIVSFPFLVIVPSTVIYETIRQGIPFLVFADKTGIYKGHNMPSEIVADEGSLCTMIQELMQNKNEQIYNNLYKDYAVSGDVKENYREAFRRLLS